MIAEAIDTVITLGWALIAWIVLTAAFATCALYAVVVTVWAVARGLWRGVTAALALVHHSSAPEPPRGAPETSQTPSRPAPSWARKDAA